MKQLTVFYDGACVLCHNEIHEYKSRDSKNLLNIIDISDINFNAENFSLDNDEINLHMHCIDIDGTIYTGVDAFIEIWKRVPPYNLIVPILKKKPVRFSVDIGYFIFANFIRKRLPKRKCTSDACQVHFN